MRYYIIYSIFYIFFTYNGKNKIFSSVYIIYFISSYKLILFFSTYKSIFFSKFYSFSYKFSFSFCFVQKFLVSFREIKYCFSAVNTIPAIFFFVIHHYHLLFRCYITPTVYHILKLF